MMFSLDKLSTTTRLKKYVFLTASFRNHKKGKVFPILKILKPFSSSYSHSKFPETYLSKLIAGLLPGYSRTKRSLHIQRKFCRLPIAQTHRSIMTLKSSYSLVEYATKRKPQVVGVTYFWHLLGDAFLSTRRAEAELLTSAWRLGFLAKILDFFHFLPGSWFS